MSFSKNFVAQDHAVNAFPAHVAAFKRAHKSMKTEKKCKKRCRQPLTIKRIAVTMS